MKFTFRKHIATGRYLSFEPDNTDIKLNKLQVGLIVEVREPEHAYKVRLAVKKDPTKESPANFKWITFKSSFESEEEARTWVNKYADGIYANHDLYRFEKE
ncbi:MAG TPA: hypothetical protein ENH82_14575 [bacterium]|nr:hypothetical protein [bacterium]